MSAETIERCRMCDQPSPHHWSNCPAFQPCARFKDTNGPWGIKPAGLPSDRCATCNGTREQHQNRNKGPS